MGQDPTLITIPGENPEFEQLLTRAAANRGKPKDIEAWAKQIASEVGKLND